MKILRNKTRQPLKIRLSQGRVLHLGPGKEGRIADHDEARESVKALVEAGEIEVISAGAHQGSGGVIAGPGRPDSHGHHPNVSIKRRGDR